MCRTTDQENDNFKIKTVLTLAYDNRNKKAFICGRQACSYSAKYAVLVPVNSVLRIRDVYPRVSDPDPYWIRIRIRNLNTDPDPGGQKLPTKVEKIHVLKCWMASFVSWRLLL